MQKPDTLRGRAAQLIFPRLGSNMPPAVSVAEDLERALRLLDEVPVGGMVVFRGHHASTPPALQALQRASRTPLLFCSDLERGAGQQVAGLTVFPHAMAQGRSGADAVERVAAATACEARSAGIGWLFAPVADVHSNPVNPIISTRAFGSDVSECSACVRAFVRGTRAGGGLSTAKHFPGHGDTDTDSHDVLPVVSKTREELEAVELAPFRAAIDAGVDAIMTAHVSYPALDPSGTAATFSEPILRGVLREELGFQGVIVSDSLLMGGAGAAVSARAAEIVRAGVDVLLDISDPDIALSALVRAVADGSLDERLVQEAFERVWTLKQTLIDRPAPVPADPGQLARRIARAAISVEGDVAGVLAGHGPIPLAVIRPHTDYPDPTRADAEALLAGHGFEVSRFGPDATADEYRAFSDAAAQAGRAVVAMIVKPAAWHAFGLLPHQAAFIRELTVPCVRACLGSPDADRELPRPAARLVALSDVPVSVQAVADLLHGAGPGPAPNQPSRAAADE
ncbi:MAG: hypothetical protein JJ896_05230 [Rhodothermales bacterium]|nr:hypothetical protein [Rhodothermales bacterium]MBO6779036.1 hypothetical protein [Rhodothermales bacterium]